MGISLLVCDRDFAVSCVDNHEPIFFQSQGRRFLFPTLKSRIASSLPWLNLLLTVIFPHKSQDLPQTPPPLYQATLKIKYRRRWWFATPGRTLCVVRLLEVEAVSDAKQSQIRVIPGQRVGCVSERMNDRVGGRHGDRGCTYTSAIVVRSRGRIVVDDRHEVKRPDTHFVLRRLQPVRATEAILLQVCVRRDKEFAFGGGEDRREWATLFPGAPNAAVVTPLKVVAAIIA